MKTLALKSLNIFVTAAFLAGSFNIPQSQAIETGIIAMPAPGSMVFLSPAFTPAHLQGMTIHPDNPLEFDFLVNKGGQNLDETSKKAEYQRLIKYFMAALTVPDEHQWVNLSPYEKNRIINNDFGMTEMGRELLAQDYLLKQLTSSLMYPESGLGKEFWGKVYERAYKEYGTTDIPVNTFNKVWIVPDQAIVYESGNSVYILKSHLKVMLEEDYLSLNKHTAITSTPTLSQDNKTHAVASKVIREVILPAIEREVNEGQNFAQLRQVVSGMILATWYKKALKESLLGKVYADKAKLKGVDQDPQNNEIIYQRYLAAFKKGVYNYIKEDEDLYSKQPVARKYFAGGIVNNFSNPGEKAMLVVKGPEDIGKIENAGLDFAQITQEAGNLDRVDAALAPTDKAMNAWLKRGLLAAAGLAIAGGSYLGATNDQIRQKVMNSVSNIGNLLNRNESVQPEVIQRDFTIFGPFCNSLNGPIPTGFTYAPNNILKTSPKLQTVLNNFNVGSFAELPNIMNNPIALFGLPNFQDMQRRADFLHPLMRPAELDIQKLMENQKGRDFLAESVATNDQTKEYFKLILTVYSERVPPLVSIDSDHERKVLYDLYVKYVGTLNEAARNQLHINYDPFYIKEVDYLHWELRANFIDDTGIVHVYRIFHFNWLLAKGHWFYSNGELSGTNVEPIILKSRIPDEALNKLVDNGVFENISDDYVRLEEPNLEKIKGLVQSIIKDTETFKTVWNILKESKQENPFTKMWEQGSDAGLGWQALKTDDNTPPVFQIVPDDSYKYLFHRFNPPDKIGDLFRSYKEQNPNSPHILPERIKRIEDYLELNDGFGATLDLSNPENPQLLVAFLPPAPKGTYRPVKPDIFQLFSLNDLKTQAPYMLHLIALLNEQKRTNFPGALYHTLDIKTKGDLLRHSVEALKYVNSGFIELLVARMRANPNEILDHEIVAIAHGIDLKLRRAGEKSFLDRDPSFYESKDFYESDEARALNQRVAMGLANSLEQVGLRIQDVIQIAKFKLVDITEEDEHNGPQLVKWGEILWPVQAQMLRDLMHQWDEPPVSRIMEKLNFLANPLNQHASLVAPNAVALNKAGAGRFAEYQRFQDRLPRKKRLLASTSPVALAPGNDAAQAANPGGIDLNANNMDLIDLKRDGKGVPLPFSQQDISALRRITGFVPQIREITPVTGPLPILSEFKAMLKDRMALAGNI